MSTRIKTDHELIETVGVDSAGGARSEPGARAQRSAGAISTIIYAHVKHWTAVVPATAWGGGLAAAILIGAMAGLLPRSAPPAFPQPKPFEPSEPTVSR